MRFLPVSDIRRSSRASARLRLLAPAALAIAACSSSSSDTASPGTTPAGQRPNILFVLMDDVGIDQMQKTMLDQDVPGLPAMPTMDTLARAGVRFQDTWAMAACSPSRAAVYTGRYPLRTKVKGALGTYDLANSMISPYEVTVPKLLAQQGYESALFGKFHVALPGNHPAGDGAVHTMGWSYFAGWLDETGDPSSIDTTAGGVAPLGTHRCGFVANTRIDPVNGADRGACRMPDGSCTDLIDGAVPPGRACRERGGLLEPDASCRAPQSAALDFGRYDSHYVSPVVFNRPDGSVERVPLTDPAARTWRARFMVDQAIDWIRSRPANRPWMATLSFATAHTPLVQAPAESDWPASIAASALDCSGQAAQRELQNLMTESMDRDVARLLVATGLATRAADGSLSYTPEASNTMIVVLGDNGSLGASVKLPFDPSRAKGTAYQTGVWVPLIVAGPLVSAPGRSVSSMVNAVDLYALFAEIAGITDVQAAAQRTLDALPMLAYLRDPGQGAIRDLNYAENGTNQQIGGIPNGPCQISSTCTQIPIDRSVCEDNNGTWWGKGTTASVNGVQAPSEGFTYCCQVNAFAAAAGGTPWSISPLASVAVRSGRYKFIQNVSKQYVSPTQACVDQTVNEYYEIDTTPKQVKLDRNGTGLPPASFDATQKAAFDRLDARLAAIRASQPECPGDGNGDLVVDERDLDGWSVYAISTGRSSVFDLDFDGLTGASDRALIVGNLGRDCRPPQAKSMSIKAGDVER